MDCQFKQFCGKDGKRTHLQKGTGLADVEVLYLCTECLRKYQDTIKRMSTQTVSYTKEEREEILNQCRKGKFMTEITDNNILIPITGENQKFVENVCTNGGYSFQTFFEHLLKLYQRSLNEPLTQTEVKPETPKKETLPKRK